MNINVDFLKTHPFTTMWSCSLLTIAAGITIKHDIAAGMIFLGILSGLSIFGVVLLKFLNGEFE